MKVGDIVKMSPDATPNGEWIEGRVINMMESPFLGIEVAIETATGDIYWAEKKYFELAQPSEECMQ